MKFASLSMVVVVLGIAGLALGIGAVVSTVAASLTPTSTDTTVVDYLSGGTGPTGPVDPSEIVTVRGFKVHVSVAGQVAALVDSAASAGLRLGGWGYRSTQRQIELRRAHCGTSDYAVWHMPSGRCRPPTARPGRSQHERGLAIDFTCNGASLAGTRCFFWLRANAANFGFYNLPSEPWHWSTTGR